MQRRSSATHDAAGPLSVAAFAALQQLSTCRVALVLDGMVTADVKSEAGYAACTAFLAAAERAARLLRLEPAERGYRDMFSANYRALFPDGNRHYRVDIFEASTEQPLAMYVNGDRFELSKEAVGEAQALQEAWADMLVAVDDWSARDTERKLDGSAVAGALAAFDACWAGFEERYICELIGIERQARHLIVHAAELESQLPTASAEVERRFVECLAHINSVANNRRKGREDLSVEILESARAAMRREAHDAGCDVDRSAAHVLAGDVLASYDALRRYFRKVLGYIEHVDPHLCNNTELVARLVDYEETWEVGAHYVQCAPLLDAVCDVVAELRAVEKLAPELTAMLEDCDVELFMILPRLLVLCFLGEPCGKRVELLRKLLPHRFSPPSDEGTSGAGLPRVDPDLKALHDLFKDTVKRVAMILQQSGMSPPGTRPSLRAAAWELIVRHAVRGGDCSGHRGDPGGDEAATWCSPPAAEVAVRELLHDVERWSLELQRRCPEDWNQCCALLVHCLSGNSNVKRRELTKFRV